MYNSQETALRIKNIAKSKKISIAELQENCGLGKNAINQLSDSQEGMKSKNIYMIADYLNVSVDYLLGRTEEPTSKAINNSYNKNGNNSVQTVGGTSEFSKRDVEILQKINSLDFKEYVDVINYINEIIKNKE